VFAVATLYVEKRGGRNRSSTSGKSVVHPTREKERREKEKKKRATINHAGVFWAI
jgi:hypothetical protein